MTSAATPGIASSDRRGTPAESRRGRMSAPRRGWSARQRRAAGLQSRAGNFESRWEAGRSLTFQKQLSVVNIGGVESTPGSFIYSRESESFAQGPLGGEA